MKRNAAASPLARSVHNIRLKHELFPEALYCRSTSELSMIVWSAFIFVVVECADLQHCANASAQAWRAVPLHYLGSPPLRMLLSIDQLGRVCVPTLNSKASPAHGKLKHSKASPSSSCIHGVPARNDP